MMTVAISTALVIMFLMIIIFFAYLISLKITNLASVFLLMTVKVCVMAIFYIVYYS